MRTQSDSRYSFTAISIEQAQQFRQLMSLDPVLVVDAWDQHSRHYAISRAGKIVGATRLTRERNGRLPLSDHVPVAAEIKPASVEIGRTLIVPEKRVAPVSVTMYRKILEEIGGFRPECSCVYVDGIEQSRLSHRALLKLGFASTHWQYFDARYNANSVVFEARCAELIEKLDGLGFDLARQAGSGSMRPAKEVLHNNGTAMYEH
jgi:predicted GNAT family N-acyltransferase